MATRKNIFAIIMLGIAIVSFSAAACAEGKKESNKEPVVSSSVKSVSGTVTAVGKDYIAVAYDRDQEKGIEYEIFLPVENTAKIEHKRKITDINVGDTVQLSYEEEVKTYSDGNADRNRKATKVSFISPAKKSPFSDENDVDGLDLKGLRGE